MGWDLRFSFFGSLCFSANMSSSFWLFWQIVTCAWRSLWRTWLAVIEYAPQGHRNRGQWGNRPQTRFWQISQPYSKQIMPTTVVISSLPASQFSGPAWWGHGFARTAKSCVLGFRIFCVGNILMIMSWHTVAIWTFTIFEIPQPNIYKYT